MSVCVKWVGVNGLVRDGIDTKHVGFKNERDENRGGLKGQSLFLSLFRGPQTKQRKICESSYHTVLFWNI